MSNGRYSVWGLESGGFRHTKTQNWSEGLGAKGGDYPWTELYRAGSSEMSEPLSSIPWWVASLGSPPPSLPVTGLHRTAGLPSSESTTRHQRFPLKDSQHAHTRGDPEYCSNRQLGPASAQAVFSLTLRWPERTPADPSTLHLTRAEPEVTEPEKTPKQAPRRGGPRETGKCQGSPKPKCKNSF